jgi:hypothetical protein
VRFRWILLLTLSLSPMGAMAADISSTFRDGIFGVPWGAPLESVVDIFPEGDSLPIGMSGYLGFWVRDRQTFLGVIREKNGVLYDVDDKDGVTAASTDDRTTQHPMLWLTIGTASYATAAAASKCDVGSVVTHP